MSRTHYEVLGINQAADEKIIRQAYLRLSLAHHPDKNPEHPEEARARFVEIGQAYEVLKDPELRRNYDRELLRGGSCQPTPTAPTTAQPQKSSYDTYDAAFDLHVAGMSEAELRAAMGTAAVVGSLIGSILGARLAGGKGFLGTTGSLLGSIVASEAASSVVQSVHQSATERSVKRQAAVERGESHPELEKPIWQDVVDKTVSSMKDKMSKSPDGATAGSNDDRWKQVIGVVLGAASQVMAQMDAADAQRHKRQC